MTEIRTYHSREGMRSRRKFRECSLNALDEKIMERNRLEQVLTSIGMLLDITLNKHIN